MGQNKQTTKKKSQRKSSENTVDTETHVFHKNTKLKTIIYMERTYKEKLKNKNN